MIMDPKVDKAIEGLISAIKESKLYEEFESKRKEVASDDVLRQQINRTRAIRAQISNMSDYEKDGQMAEALMEEYDKLLDITVIHEFSLTELEFCGMYREVLSRVVSSFNLDIKAGD